MWSFETYIPGDYYSMPFCKPHEGVLQTDPGTAIGFMLENSQYNFTVMVRTT
jgi:transmembrane 9 superfamily protein 2/4